MRSHAAGNTLNPNHSTLTKSQNLDDAAVTTGDRRRGDAALGVGLGDLAQLQGRSYAGLRGDGFAT